MLKKKGTKITALMLAAMMAASAFLSGCGGADSGSSQTGAAAQSGNTESAKENAGSDTGSAGKTKITMITYLGNPTRDALIQEMVAGLDNIELEIISPPADQATQKISTMLQAGEDIDIIELDSVPVDHISNGFIEPLNSYVENWEDWGSVSEFLKDQVTSYDGNIYSIPYGVYERALFYRKDWFEDKNIAVPKTWDDLYNAAVELTDPTQNRYGYSFRGGAGTVGFMQMTLLSFADPAKLDIGVPFIANDCKSIYDQPEAIDALNFYKKLYEDGSHPDSIAWGYPEMVEAFYSGVTAMLIQDPEVVATCEEYMEEGTWDVAPLPVGPSGQALFPAGFAGWGIAANSKNKDAAWDFLYWLYNDNAGVATFAAETGYLPCSTKISEMPVIKEKWAQNPNCEIAYNQLEYGNNDHMVMQPNNGDIANNVAAMMEACFYDYEDVTEQMNILKEEAEDILADLQ